MFFIHPNLVDDGGPTATAALPCTPPTLDCWCARRAFAVLARLLEDSSAAREAVDTISILTIAFSAMFSWSCSDCTASDSSSTSARSFFVRPMSSWSQSSTMADFSGPSGDLARASSISWCLSVCIVIAASVPSARRNCFWSMSIAISSFFIARPVCLAELKMALMGVPFSLPGLASVAATSVPATCSLAATCSRAFLCATSLSFFAVPFLRASIAVVDPLKMAPISMASISLLVPYRPPRKGGDTELVGPDHVLKPSFLLSSPAFTIAGSPLTAGL
mmetsp:Transcript_4480/g.6594  ORF Transcript_4480/g.6594 Transcript_4480/m.6594 type:complete len:277 (-) Transcript_4480:382-1212(-)